MAPILLNLLSSAVAYTGPRPDPQAAYVRRDVDATKADPKAALVARR